MKQNKLKKETIVFLIISSFFVFFFLPQVESYGNTKSILGPSPSFHIIHDLEESTNPYLISYQDTYVIYGTTRFSSFHSSTLEDPDEEGNVYIGIYDKNWNFLRGKVFGGCAFDFPRTLAIDEHGVIAIAGGTSSPDFPVTNNALQKAKSIMEEQDSFFCCLQYDTLDIIYSTYYGGNADDVIDLVIASDDRYFLLGSTESTDLFTTKNAHQSIKKGSGNLFFTVLSKTYELLYSSYYGEYDNYPFDMILHPETGQILIGGRIYKDCFEKQGTASPALFTTASFQESPAGLFDGYFLVLHPETYQIDYQTYFGKQKDDWIRSMKLLSSTQVLFYGNTNSSNFYTTSNAFQNTLEDDRQSCFVSILDWSTNELTYSSFLGGKALDLSFNCFLAEDGILVTGLTRSPDFPVSYFSSDNRARSDNSRSYFVCKFSYDGALLYSSLFYHSNFWMCSKSVLYDNSVFLLGETQKGSKGAFLEIPISTVQQLSWDIIIE